MEELRLVWTRSKGASVGIYNAKNELLAFIEFEYVHSVVDLCSVCPFSSHCEDIKLFGEESFDALICGQTRFGYIPKTKDDKLLYMMRGKVAKKILRK